MFTSCRLRKFNCACSLWYTSQLRMLPMLFVTFVVQRCRGPFHLRLHLRRLWSRVTARAVFTMIARRPVWSRKWNRPPKAFLKSWKLFNSVEHFSTEAVQSLKFCSTESSWRFESNVYSQGLANPWKSTLFGESELQWLFKSAFWIF